MAYTNTNIAGFKYASGNRVLQVCVTDFGGVIIYPLPHRRESHTSLYQYFMNAGVPDHIHSYNILEVNKISKWKKVPYEEGGIEISQKRPHSPLQNSTER